VSIQDIQQNPQDTSNFYLANIYQVIADPNRPNSSLPSSPPPFSPPTYAVCVNALWFLSLVISLTCALLATLLQQWARRYLKVTQPPRYSPHRRARIRAFFFEGVDKFLLPWTVEALPTLLHASLFLFFAGLVVFLCNVNFTIFKLVLSWVGVCTALYGCITVMPIFRHDSPYYTPLSSSVWPFAVGALYVIRWVHRWFASSNFHRPGALQRSRVCFHKMLSQGMHRTAEETALNSPPDIDIRTFVWTLDALDEDHELERFFSGLPGFRSSKVVDDPLPRLTLGQRWKLSTALTGLYDRTFSSDLLPDTVKRRRAIICAKAIDPTHTPEASIILVNMLSKHRYSGPLAADILQIIRGWGSIRGGDTNLAVRAAVCSVVASVQQRDDSWFILASSEMGVPETVLRDYATTGANLEIAILIYITRLQSAHYQKWSWPSYAISNVLEAASKFSAKDTLPELQHEFCALWNKVVFKARRDHNGSIEWYILRPTCNIFAALHRDTTSVPTRLSASTDDWDDDVFQPSSYPVCKCAGQNHDDSRATVGNDIAELSLEALTSPNAPSSSLPALTHVIECVTDALSLDTDIPFQISLRSADQKNTECHRITDAPPTTFTNLAIQRGMNTSGRTRSLSTSDTPACTPPSLKASTSLQSAGAIRHAEARHAPDFPGDPLSKSPLIFDNTQTTGLPWP
jgi:hypothetical protein